jgi:broad specificity phosphatase PhoE
MGLSKATLVLVRHGCTINDVARAPSRLTGWTDCPLSSVGVEQARRVALKLGAEGPFACTYASPLERARDTAEPIVAATGTALVLCHDLREINCGALDGLEVGEVERRYPRTWAANLEQTDPDFRWPEGESYREFRARCVGIIDEIAEQHRGERVIVVTHAGLVNQLVGYLMDTSAARWEPYRPRNATITEVEWLEGTGRVLRFGDERHLDVPPAGTSAITGRAHRLDV